MEFIFIGTGILFILIGLLLVGMALARPERRERLLYSGLGSLIVGLGNIFLVYNALVGLFAVVFGIFLILAASRARR